MTRDKLEIHHGDGPPTEINLGPSSYVVLGMIGRIGPSTPYDLKQAVLKSVAFFWDFPQSQLYVEPPRLAEAGLLSEDREEFGRRRRVFSLTELGRTVLDEWLEAPSDTATEARDVGLLKLSFGALTSPERILEHAREQLKMHQDRLAVHNATSQRLNEYPGLRPHQITVSMGERFEQAFIDFWNSVIEDPPVEDPTL